MTDPAGPFALYGITDLSVEKDPAQAVARIRALYDGAVARLRGAFEDFLATGRVPARPVAFYPYVGLGVASNNLRLDGRLAFGALHDPGFYGTTLTRPDLFAAYYENQLRLIMENHGVPVVVGVSGRPIPLPYVVDVGRTAITAAQAQEIVLRFPVPDLSATDDAIANGTRESVLGEPKPLSLFTAERVDYSLQRLYHYTGTSPRAFQRYVLLTNYQRYIDDFVDLALREVTEGKAYDRFVAPGNVTTFNPRFQAVEATGAMPAHLPQMPAYHLTRPDGSGVTMVNIGVGPSNARTITDHVAVMRPHCWLMLGHCAGLRRSQQLGDYVLAHGYVREDHVLDQEVPPFVPIPPIAEVQVALQEAVANVTGLKGHDAKLRMRTGTVATTANRNWELRYDELFKRLNQAKTIAVDMESATIAANGLRFRVPYGTLLCVSDKPLHGEIKLRGMANRFYQERVNQHLLIGLDTIRLLREQGPERLHSRKLRSFDEPAFR
ncbi:MAG: AMP nucleosidase [Geminicoccaceae bacterium]|nr:AMP nucleosidase [Geminicoccaceae bacterium]